MVWFIPSQRWAWPAGSLHQLLMAVLCPDEPRALAAIQDWLKMHDFEKVGFREHRLLAAIAERHGKRLRDYSAHPLLLGLQRQLWTRSRMAAAEAEPILQAFAAAGIRVMLLKGWARIAAHPDDQRSRVAHDLDILVQPSEFPRAMSILFAMGWSAASGCSSHCLQAESSTLRAMNFFSGRFGDIDLHQWGYGKGAPIAAIEADAWAHAAEVRFHGVDLLVPSATDRLAMAMAHSGLEAHSHSDWVVDCAQLITDESIDWVRLLDLLVALRAQVAAQVVFTYFDQQLGLSVPRSFLTALDLAQPGWAVRWADLLQCIPRTQWTLPTRLARGLVKQWRLSRAPTFGKVNAMCGKMGPVSKSSILPVFGLRHSLGVLSPEGGDVTFDIEILVMLTGVARRLEFEMHTADRHLTRLRAKSLWRRRGLVKVRFEGKASGVPSGSECFIESRPGRWLRQPAEPAEVARYGAIPFVIQGVSMKTSSSPQRADLV